MRIADYAVKKLGAKLVLETEEQEYQTRYCCPEMAAMVGYSDAVFEDAETPEEWERAIQDPDHVEIRKAIAAHRCMPDEVRAFADSLPANWREKWLEAYRND